MKKILINYLKNKDTDEKSIVLACHGYDIFVSDLINFILIAFIGILTQTFQQSLIFYIFFAFLRSSTGGYHANTKLKCILTYGTIYFIFTLLLKLRFFNITLLNLFLTILSTSLILLLAPVQHVNNPLTLKEYKTNKRKVLWKSIILFTIYFVLLILNNPNYAVFSIILIYTLALILLHMYTNNYLEVLNYDN